MVRAKVRGRVMTTVSSSVLGEGSSSVAVLEDQIDVQQINGREAISR
jgi:hypothetical protein